MNNTFHYSLNSFTCCTDHLDNLDVFMLVGPGDFFPQTMSGTSESGLWTISYYLKKWRMGERSGEGQTEYLSFQKGKRKTQGIMDHSAYR